MNNKHIRENVLKILEKYPKTRDDDNKLIYEYIFNYYALTNECVVLKNIFNRLDIKLYTICRERANIQNNDKLFLPSKEVQEKRKNYEKVCRNESINYGIDYKPCTGGTKKSFWKEIKEVLFYKF